MTGKMDRVPNKPNAIDRRPWFCVNCSDRFANQQPSSRHATIWKPRLDGTMVTVPNKPKTPTSTFRIPVELKAAAQERAEAEGKTLTDVVVDALTKYAKGRKR